MKNFAKAGDIILGLAYKILACVKQDDQGEHLNPFLTNSYSLLRTGTGYWGAIITQ